MTKNVTRRKVLGRGALALLGGVAASLWPGRRARAHEDHGDPADLTIRMGEMYFSPGGVEEGEPFRFPAGEPHLIHFINEGEVDHEVHVGREPSLEENTYLENLLGLGDEHARHGFMGLDLRPGESGTLHVWIPEERRGEWQIALGLIDELLADDVPRAPVVADSAYGDVTAFREALTTRGLGYVLAVKGDTSVWRPGLEPVEPRRKRAAGPAPARLRRDENHQPIKIERLAASLPSEAWREVRWREESKGVLHAHVAVVNVRPAHHDNERSDPPSRRRRHRGLRSVLRSPVRLPLRARAPASLAGRARQCGAEVRLENGLIVEADADAVSPPNRAAPSPP